MVTAEQLPDRADAQCIQKLCLYSVYDAKDLIYTPFINLSYKNPIMLNFLEKCEYNSQ